MKLAIIADDLTGAGDSGAQLVRRGIRANILLNEVRTDAGDAVIIDTDSRMVSSQSAYGRVYRAAGMIQKAGCDKVFKKLDSTMRGHIGQELDACMDALRPDFIFIAPGHPLKGRTVRDGFLYVNGKLLHETEVSHDPGSPVNESHLPTLLRSQTERGVALITQSEYGKDAFDLSARLQAFRREDVAYVIFDSETEDDLRRIARLAEDAATPHILAGSAGLAKFWPLDVEWFTGVSSKAAYCEEISEKKICSALEKPIKAGAGESVLLVVGSASRTSRFQLLEVLDQPNVTQIEVEGQVAAWNEREREAWLKQAVCRALEGKQSNDIVALYLADNGIRYEESGKLAESLADAAKLITQSANIGALVLTGGDTAHKVCCRLGAERIELAGEIEPDVPVGWLIDANRRRAVVTKAGGFGKAHVLWKAILQLRGDGEQ